MIHHYVTVAWRNIVRNKLYVAINVGSLTIGICACLVVYLIAHYEFSFDNFHPDRDRIFRVVSEIVEDGDGARFVGHSIPGPLLATTKEEISGIETLAGLQPLETLISIPDQGSESRKFESLTRGGYITTVFTESSYFDIFKYQWLAGNLATALREPFKVVLTESRARQYFGSLDLERILGKVVVYHDSLQVSVSGIVRDWNENTDLPFTDFISIGTIKNSFLNDELHLDSWRQSSLTVFVKLEKGTQTRQIDSQFQRLIDKHKDELVGAGRKQFVYLQSLANIHFTGDFNRGNGPLHGDGDDFRKAHMPTLYGLMSAALFVLLIGIVNYINLSTALSLKRAREIGVRKVMGSPAKAIAIQFLLETFAQTSIAVCLSAVLVKPLLLAFDSYIPHGIEFDLLSPPTLLFILMVTLLTSLLAGFYPAKVLSSYLPVLSLKGISGFRSDNKEYLRRGLIVFQFAISLVFIIGAVVIGNQIRFMSKELHFTKGVVFSVYAEGDNAKVLADRIRQFEGVDHVALQDNAPIGPMRIVRSMNTTGVFGSSIGVSVKRGDEDFIALYDIQLLAGRNLKPTDSLRELVINRAYSKMLGFTKPEGALGQLIYMYGVSKPYPVVGVIEDFHEGSLHETIGPMVIANNPQGQHDIAIKVGSKDGQKFDLQATLSKIEKQWKIVYPGKPIEFDFLDDYIGWLNEKDQRSANLVNVVMIVAIFISCIGVFGLSVFSTQVRTKEIGIRKVLGATVVNIMTLLGREIALLVIIAALISAPIAWYLMNDWLNGFAYRINIAWWMFFISGLGAMMVAFITVSFQSAKAARTNPVKSLRSE